MSDVTNFMSLVLEGKVPMDAIDDFIDRWHENPMGLALHEYLGLSRVEYGLWLDYPDSLPLIITSRKANRPLEALMEESSQEMRLATRTYDSEGARKIEDWLHRRHAS